jgi:hypothetical protein
MALTLNIGSKYNNMYLYTCSTEFKQNNAIMFKILNFTVPLISNTNQTRLNIN